MQEKIDQTTSLEYTKKQAPYSLLPRTHPMTLASTTTAQFIFIAQAEEVPRRGARHIPSGRSERRPPPSETEGVPPLNHSADVRHGVDERTELSRQKYHAEKSERVERSALLSHEPGHSRLLPPTSRNKKKRGTHTDVDNSSACRFSKLRKNKTENEDS